MLLLPPLLLLLPQLIPVESTVLQAMPVSRPCLPRGGRNDTLSDSERRDLQGGCRRWQSRWNWGGRLDLRIPADQQWLLRAQIDCSIVVKVTDYTAMYLVALVNAG